MKLLLELLNSPLPWTRRESPTNVVYTVQVPGLKGGEDRKLRAMFRRRSAGDLELYEFEFSVNGDADLSGDGGEIRIFSTVVAILQDFVGAERPDGIVFGAERGTGRGRLYRRLFNRVGSGWRLHSAAEAAGFGGDVGEFMDRRVVVDGAIEWFILLPELAVQESLNSAWSWRRVFRGSEEVVYRAEAGERVLLVNFYLVKGGWTLSFSVDGELGLTGHGGERGVFSTVAEIVRDWARHSGGELLLYAALAGTGRSELYSRLWRRWGVRAERAERFQGQNEAERAVLAAFLAELRPRDEGWVVRVPGAVQESWADRLPIDVESLSPPVLVATGVRRVSWGVEESLDRPVELQVRAGRDRWRAEAEIDGRLFRFSASAREDGDGTWEIDFSRVDGGRPRYSLTGDGVPFRVLGFVLSALQQFVAEVQPAAILWSYDETERSPAVYDRLMRRVGWVHARSWAVGDTAIDRLYVPRE